MRSKQTRTRVEIPTGTQAHFSVPATPTATRSPTYSGAPTGSNYDRIKRLLESNRVDEALQLARTRANSDAAMRNAYAVCLMRSGQPEEALALYRGLLLNGIFLRPEVPTVYKSNFATALALSGQLDGALSVLQEIAPEKHPMAERLLAAINERRQRQSFWQKLRCLWGSAQPRIELDFPPGELR